MIKKQVILGTIESRTYNRQGHATYKYGGCVYHVENVNGQPKVTSIEVPQDDLATIEVIVRK